MKVGPRLTHCSFTFAFCKSNNRLCMPCPSTNALTQAAALWLYSVLIFIAGVRPKYTANEAVSLRQPLHRNKFTPGFYKCNWHRAENTLSIIAN